MKTSNDVLVALIAVKELEIKIKDDRIAQLTRLYNTIYDENTLLLAKIETMKNTTKRHIGYTKD